MTSNYTEMTLVPVSTESGGGYKWIHSAAKPVKMGHIVSVSVHRQSRDLTIRFQRLQAALTRTDVTIVASR
jgi:hypothetical protein